MRPFGSRSDARREHCQIIEAAIAQREVLNHPRSNVFAGRSLVRVDERGSPTDLNCLGDLTQLKRNFHIHGLVDENGQAAQHDSRGTPG